ncbi:MAG: hypothetical protein EXR90_01945 [Methyloglobulus sp.]|nr:hypothetical protein [Methyloglobulus sp.]
MTIETLQVPASTAKSEPAADKNPELLSTIDMEDIDASAGEDDLAFPPESDLTNNKVAVRRKIELHWEKKRLQEQLGDFGEIDFDF